MNLKSLYQLFATHKEGRWIMHYPNAVALYRFVIEHPVRRVLELGTGIGCSTAVVALALKDKGEQGEIHTVEQNEKCLALAQELIPEELKSLITFHRTDPMVWTTEHLPYQYFSTFASLPEGDWDLILVDGPGPFMRGDKYIDLPNGDVMRLLIEDKLKAGTSIAWDGRKKALSTLEQYFGDNFFLTQVADNNDFNIIERKDNSLHFEDHKLMEMKNLGYE